MDRKYLQVAKELLAEIERGVYAVGDSLPPVRKIAEMYGINPQTANKATAHLVSIGAISARKGARSTVLGTGNIVKRRISIPILIDSFRAKLLEDLNDISNYHGKDIYLSYLMMIARLDMEASIIVYEREAKAVTKGLAEKLAGASGVIVQGDLPESISAYLSEKNIPAVFLNRNAPPFDGRFASIMIPTTKMYDMANYLVSLGHRRFIYAFSKRLERNCVYEERLSTLERALSEHGIGPESIQRLDFSASDRGDASKLRDLMAEGFTAVVSNNDISALGIYELAGASGVKIPQELSVVGFDDIAIAQIASPPLTTIHVDRREMVEKAFSAINELRSPGSPSRILSQVATELIIRKSAYRCPA